LELIASRLEVSGGKVTGKILGKNCHGDEKVVRIKEVYDLTNYNIIAAYGDTGGDKPMLELADQAHYRPFS
jgi:phosphoserine phosphatase